MRSRVGRGRARWQGGVGATLLALVATIFCASAEASQTHLFAGPFGEANEPQFVSANSLAVDQGTGDVLVLDAGSNEVQSLKVSATSGQFRLSYGGFITGDLAFNITAANLRTALLNLTGFTGAITVTGGPGNAKGSTPYTIIFQSRDAEQLVPSNGTTPLAGGDPTSEVAVTTTTPGVNGAIKRFNSDGTPESFTALGTNVIDGNGSGDETPENGFSFHGGPGDQQITVDNSGGATDGDIYVTQRGSGLHLVDIFSSDGEYLGQLTEAGGAPFVVPCGVAVDPAGDLFVADQEEGKIYRYAAAAHNPLENGDFEKSFSDPAFANPCNLAAGAGASAGSLYVDRFFGGAGNSVVKLNAASGAVEKVFSGEYRLIAVDPSTGHLYAFSAVTRTPAEEAEGRVGNELREFDAAGAPISVKAVEFDVRGLAVSGMSGAVYVSQGSGSGGALPLRTYGPLVTLPDVTTEPAQIINNTSVTLRGTVDPDGVAVEECFFEYLSDAEYQANSGGNRFAGAVKASCEDPDAGEIGSGTQPVEVHADIAGLEAETLYHYRLAAANSAAAEYPEDSDAVVLGKEVLLQTPSKPRIVAEWSEAVGSEEATLKATINPENAETTYRFQWGVGSVEENETSAQPVASGRDAEDHTVEIVLHELTPGTSYRWRVVAENALGGVVGQERDLRTFGTLLPGLPDDRVYELVSPTQKGGGEVGVRSAAGGGGPQQASSSGEAVAYSSFTAFEDPKAAPNPTEYRSVRHPYGWSTEATIPPYEENIALEGFSEDLSHFAVNVQEPPLTANATVAFPDLYWRDNLSGGLVALVTEEHPPLVDPKALYCLGYGGSSADGSRAFFLAKATLEGIEPAPLPGDGFSLYEWSAAGTRLVSVLPNGAPAKPAPGTGFGAGGQGCGSSGVLRRAISADGSRAVWTFSGTFSGAPSPLLDRVDGAQTVQLDKPNTGVAGGGGEGHYVDASTDGSEVFFTDTRKLTAGASATSGNPDLYRYDFDAPEGERLTDLTPPDPVEIEGVPNLPNVKSVIGASREGDYAYFLASGVLSGEEENAGGEKAEVGQSNLYVWHEGDGVRFIARLDSAEQAAPARVNAAGDLAFLSSRSLTGFDNTEASHEDCGNHTFGGDVCPEVFLYDYGSNVLACASCSPSGSRPLGPASLPAATTAFGRPRYLSDNGSRLFFQSSDVLLPADTNGRQDVYELERPGSGSCDEMSGDFFASASGCLYLISPGSTESVGLNDASYLVDASVDGRDVFIATRERLYPSDEDERFDVYDARVEGGIPFERPVPPEGRGPGSGSPAVGSAGTAGFSGPESPAPKHSCPKGRRQVRRHGKVRCVPRRPRHHHARRHRHHRAPRIAR